MDLQANDSNDESTSENVARQNPPRDAPNPEPPLFRPSRVKSGTNWEFISLVAPTREERSWESSDAKCAYCTKCKVTIPWSTKNPKNIKRHMEKYHSAFLTSKRKAEETKTDTNTEAAPATITDHFAKKQKGVGGKNQLKKLTAANQSMGEALLVKWVSESLRPFVIVQDEGFRDFLHHISNCDGFFAVPCRNTIRNQLTRVSKLVCDKLKNLMEFEMNYFSVTTDIWSSRTMESFMALTISYVTKEFEMRNFTLEVSPLTGRHTGDFIENCLQENLKTWGINDSKLVMLTRDNASNIIKACNNWGIPHFGCIAHGLHLVVGPFFMVKSSKQQFDHNDEIIEDVVDYGEDEVWDAIEEIPLSSREIVNQIATKINHFRSIAKYVRKSTIAKEKLDHFQKLTGEGEPLSLDLDVKTRWNSTFLMLEKFVKVREAVGAFLSHLKSPIGRAEFNNKKLPSITEEDWLMIYGVCLLFHMFYLVTAKLSGEKYPTFIFALPLLRSIKSHLSDRETLLTSDGAKQMYDIYGNADCYESVIQKLQKVRELLLQSFTERFSSVTIDIMWTTLLDPRCRKLKHLSESERVHAKEMLIQKAIEESLADQSSVIAVVATTCSSPTVPQRSNRASELFPMRALDLVIIDSPTREPNIESPSVEYNTTRQMIEAAVRFEVESYLNPEVNVHGETKALKWWNKNFASFPKLGKLAQKWLSVNATSTASERVFSDCGLAITAKRNRLTGFALREQVLVRRNLKHLKLSTEDIMKALN